MGASYVDWATATMNRDEYGFTLVKFEHRVPYSSNSFACPLHAQQVFFVDDMAHLGWKVILRKEPECV